MTNLIIFRRLRLSVALLGATLLACQSNTAGGFRASEESSCNPLLTALIGGVIGAAVADNRKKGAAIGAGVGAIACIAVNVASRQTRSANDVEEEYRKRHAGRLPPTEPVLEAYNTSLSPGSELRAGQKMQVVSNMTVVRGAQQPVREVKEVLTVVGQDKSKEPIEKRANERAESGGYENTFALTFPKDVRPGPYMIATQLFVNGKQMGERRHNFAVLAEGPTPKVALAQPLESISGSNVRN